MMEMTMFMPKLSQKGQTEKEQRKLARAMRAVFGTGENLSFELAGEGIYITPRTCNRWMSCQTSPSDAMGQIIRKLIRKIGQQKAKAILAHVEEICGSNL